MTFRYDFDNNTIDITTHQEFSQSLSSNSQTKIIFFQTAKNIRTPANIKNMYVDLASAKTIAYFENGHPTRERQFERQNKDNSKRIVDMFRDLGTTYLQNTPMNMRIGCDEPINRYVDEDVVVYEVELPYKTAPMNSNKKPEGILFKKLEIFR